MVWCMIFWMGCNSGSTPTPAPADPATSGANYGASRAPTMAAPRLQKPEGSLVPHALPVARLPGVGCQYEEFKSTCHLVDVQVQVRGTKAGVMAHYAVDGQDRQVPWNLYVGVEHSAATETFVRDHADAPCGGMKLVSGDGCSLGRVRVILPPLDFTPLGPVAPAVVPALPAAQ